MVIDNLLMRSKTNVDLTLSLFALGALIIAASVWSLYYYLADPTLNTTAGVNYYYSRAAPDQTILVPHWIFISLHTLLIVSVLTGLIHLIRSRKPKN